MPTGGAVEWPLGIFMSDSPDRDTTSNISTRDIGMCDKTLIIEQDKFLTREFFKKGTNYVDAVVRILNTAHITKINIPETHYTLPADHDYKTGTKKHLACNDLLSAINYTALWVDEQGVMRSEPYIRPSDRPITHTYDTNKDSIVMPDFRESEDIANRPNVFKRVALNIEDDRELISVFINNDPSSSISTVSRGRQIVDFEQIDEIASQEALDTFVDRLAIESTSALTHLSFGSVLMPTHGRAETLMCIFPEIFDSPLKFQETGWEMPLVYDGVMQHTARRVIRL